MNIFYEPYRVLERVYQEGAHLKLALAELPEGEHGRTVKIAYGVLEHDGYLNLCIASVAPKRPRPALALILKIALYCMLFADMPRPVAVNEAVALTKLLKKEGAASPKDLRDLPSAPISPALPCASSRKNTARGRSAL